jgi:hypothetical protein
MSMSFSITQLLSRKCADELRNPAQTRVSKYNIFVAREFRVGYRKPELL